MGAAISTTSKTETDSPRWMRLLAMMTGALAAVAGYLTVRSTVLANGAIFHCTQAVLYQDKASDSWTEYQADSIKARVGEVALQSASDGQLRQQLLADAQTFRGRQPVLKNLATFQESRREAELAESARLMRERDIMQYASMAVQLGIALASVAALTRRFPLFMFGAAAGLLGVGITGYGLLYHFLSHRGVT